MQTSIPIVRCGRGLFAAAAPVIVAACGASPHEVAAAPTTSPAASSASAGLPPPAPTREGVVTRMGALVVAPSSHNLLKNATFDGGKSLPWMTSFTHPAEGDASVEAGAFCVHVENAGTNAWDAQFRHREMTLEHGHAYSVRLKIASTAPAGVLLKVGMSGPPYKAYWQKAIDAGSEPQVVQGTFTMEAPDDATAELAFQTGGHAAAAHVPFDVCVDDVVLEDPVFTPRPEAAPPPVPNVLVNQVGYLPGLSKIATVKSESATPLTWELADATGRIVLTGTTAVRGADAASGDHVHVADFSAYTKAGAGYVLRVGRDASHPFAIGADVYKKLRIDALHYFYHSRSGLEIAMPYAGDPKWTRPAGHTGDKSVPCAPDAHCDYSLDVSGGWYDAGDHGKYVVSAGISTWTLMNAYERAKLLAGAPDAFADGTMAIPEHHNGVSDLLDEVRWELDFMMKMQVPADKPLPGMVHHKIHDREWTGLATRPDQDPIPRLLRPVSTGATLNLAAAAAQCSRVWRTIDPAFSARCLASAERAWAAAAEHPAMIAPASDSTGGGPYEDENLSDEFYWAACELYATTKKDTYKDFLEKSPHNGQIAVGADGGDMTAMSWADVTALGTITLAVVPNGLPKAEVAGARAAITRAADVLLGVEQREGYAVAFAPSKQGYPWGSTSSLLNNAMVLGLAYDLTKDVRYLGAVEDALGYLLGRNPLDQSFVTGYGFRPLEHPHHRFWAHQANAAFPEPPPGVLSGGPNSGLQDPYVKAAGLAGCTPMKCFADNIEAWSANEEAINWNAPLVWVSAYLDEHARVFAPSAQPAASKPRAP